jgi:hypothetical protein
VAGLPGRLVGTRPFAALRRSLSGRLARRLLLAGLSGRLARGLLLAGLSGRLLVLLRRCISPTLACILAGRILLRRRLLAASTLADSRRLALLALRGADLVRHAERGNGAGIYRTAGLKTINASRVRVLNTPSALPISNPRSISTS